MAEEARLSHSIGVDAADKVVENIHIEMTHLLTSLYKTPAKSLSALIAKVMVSRRAVNDLDMSDSIARDILALTPAEFST